MGTNDLAHIGSNKRTLLATVCEAGQDFEWYPTTDEILANIKTDMQTTFYSGKTSILDCGSGDGRVLMCLGSGDKFAIEKSDILRDAMSDEICIVGTDFTEQTLIDKRVDVVFSNPPYSQFVAWAEKIIREANARVIYLVIPDRWQSYPEIAQAIELRKAKHAVIGEFDFLQAERQARARVHVLRVQISSRHGESKDPFAIWFDSYSAFAHFIVQLYDRKICQRESWKSHKLNA